MPDDVQQQLDDLRADLVRDLTDFARDLTDGPLTRLVGGVLERAGTDPAVDELRQQLIDDRFAALGLAFHQLDDGAQIVFDIESAEDRSLLRQITNAQTRAAIHW